MENLSDLDFACFLRERILHPISDYRTGSDNRMNYIREARQAMKSFRDSSAKYLLESVIRDYC